MVIYCAIIAGMRFCVNINIPAAMRLSMGERAGLE